MHGGCNPSEGYGVIIIIFIININQQNPIKGNTLLYYVKCKNDT